MKMKIENAFYVEPDGIARGLALWWSNNVKLSILRSEKNIIDTKISINGKTEWFDTFIYAPPYTENKQKFWEKLASLRNDVNVKWCVIGDFNVVASPEEKCGGNPFDHNSAKWYYDFLDQTYLMEIPSSGGSFTWSNQRSNEEAILEKLDRVLSSLEWNFLFPKAISIIDVVIASDHAPIILLINGVEKKAKREFKFESRWLMEEECSQVVKEEWENTDHGPSRGYNDQTDCHLVRAKTLLHELNICPTGVTYCAHRIRAVTYVTYKRHKKSNELNRIRGAMVARLTPDQKVACSIQAEVHRCNVPCKKKLIVGKPINNGKSLRSFMHTLSLKTDDNKDKLAEEIRRIGKAKVLASIFTFRELSAATNNFNPNRLIGEGGFGRVYQGYIEAVDQAEPLLKDRQKFTLMVDPLLKGNYPVKGLCQALAVAAICLKKDAETRAIMADVVTAIEFLARPKDNEIIDAELQVNSGVLAKSLKEGSIELPD
ncbi:hypothetical protein V6N12_063079 [Hibiscus sabdariffa]|uniref:Uncharacterized protein n=1 Tax=Hibiscus sabdariffa TaxID=183260 RepID=A0ABR2FAP8_9ROSI